MSLVRVGDIVRDRYGVDDVLILGHCIDNGERIAWSGLHIPRDREVHGEAFLSAYPYDFAEDDAVRAGGMMPADPWSTWTT